MTVLSAGLALPGDDVFYFGNAVAESGNAPDDARVTTADLLLARNNPRSSVLHPAAVDFAYDYDRDGDVNATDVLLARNNQTNFLDNLQLIDLSVAESPAVAESAPSELAWFVELSQDARSTSRDSQQTAVDAVLATYWQ